MRIVRDSISAWLIVALLSVGGTIGTAQETIYRPKLATPDTLEPFLKLLPPGSDGFETERQATGIEARLGELSEAMRAGRVTSIADSLLAADFRGAPLPAPTTASKGDLPFEVTRMKDAARETTLDARRFSGELRRFVEDSKSVTVAEFQVTSIEPAPMAALLRTRVRYDIVGAGTAAWRVERVGVWTMTWRNGSSGWRVVSWVTDAHVASRAARPVFTEVTSAVLGGNDSVARQLTTDLDTWMTRIDSVLTRDSNGHHGVSVGDADGDGLDDLYVAQPAGLPNRLFRARGDGTFEDTTERAGLGVLDDTAQSLFADVENDGDQDLVLATGTRPLLFLNDGKGRFAIDLEAFRFEQPLQGSLTSIAMADYDRDGFLDFYLCVYAYFYGAGDDKAGTPMPYYDARNGPPGVLFRNDGRGRFVEVTKEAGLEAGNDRYHFAAAWADYDGDGWQDLLVANDFGTKNLYRNRGSQNGRVTFEDVAATAGLLDHGAGMSAAFLDYDNDGLLDVYTGNMWSASGLRITTSPAFMPDAPADVRALYRRHARGNSLFRNRGDGRFDDKTLEARAEMGRWAWSSDGLDFDSDGWEDLYVANGMLTRKDGPTDLDGFFWRQVVARSPLTRVTGTPYDDAWRAINHLLVHESIASRQRNVLLRNDGQGGFDEVSGAAGLDLDQDGRSFAVLDVDWDGDPDLAVMAARQSPQLRMFRNDVAPRGASLALRLTGTAGNRDAIGARVIVETDRLKRTKVVQAGSGFLSQHSKELLFGLGASQQIRTLTVVWPSGGRQSFSDVALNVRLKLTEGGTLDATPFAAGASGGSPATGTEVRASPPPDTTWLYEPVPAPDFSLPDLAGQTRSLAALRGKPALVLLWSSEGAGSKRRARRAGARPRRARQGGRRNPRRRARSARASGEGPRARAVRAARRRREPGGWTELRDPPPPRVHEPAGPAPADRPAARRRGPGGPDVSRRGGRGDGGAGCGGHRRAAGRAPVTRHALPGHALRTAAAAQLPAVRPGAAGAGTGGGRVVAFERAAQANPNASTLYRLGTLLTKSGEIPRAREAFERALALKPDLAEASNDLGALLAQGGDLEAAIARFRAALAAAPDYPDALNNLGYALLLSGQDAEARSLYEKALALQPDFPEAINNLGLLFGRAGDLDTAERYFRDALSRRADYGQAANNLALVLVARGDGAGAARLVAEFLEKVPQFEDGYITLAKIHLAAGRLREGIGVLERLLQRNPTHAVAQELLKDKSKAK